LIERINQLLLMQGFCQRDIDGVPCIDRLAKWTPLACAVCGTIGLFVGSGWYFVVLGILTLTGGLTNRSIYDRFYNATFRHLLQTAPVPPHGAPRRFGCAIGGTMYMVGGLGFFVGNHWLAVVPTIIMIVLATIAGLTQWCFASALYAGLGKLRK